MRFGKRPKPAAKRARNRRFAQGLAVLLTPAALIALALGIWGILAALKLTSAFAIRAGWFSHWLVWLVTALLLESCSFALNRYGRREAPFRRQSREGPAERAGRAKRTERTAARLP